MPRISWKSLPSQGIIVVTGARGEGKSALAWWLAQTMQPKVKKQVVALNVPKVAQSAFPKKGFGRGGIRYIDEIEDIENLKPSIIVIDEAIFVLNARRAMSDNNLMWMELAAVCRHKGHLLIFICQNTRQIDIQLLAEADYVIMKRPTIQHLRTCRKEFEPELQQAWERFNEMRTNTKKKAYVVDYANANGAMLTASMPTWWNNKVSKAYATASFSSKKRKNEKAGK